MRFVNYLPAGRRPLIEEATVTGRAATAQPGAIVGCGAKPGLKGGGVISNVGSAGLPPEQPPSPEPPATADELLAVPADAQGQQVPVAAEAEWTTNPVAADQPDPTAALLVTISETLERVAASSERYHARAEQREGVIDHLHSEVDRLRRGERRGLLRPLLVEICRLRNDLLRQAEDLPDDFDAERARLLLRSYAESSSWRWRTTGSRPSHRSRATASCRGCTGAWAASLPVTPGSRAASPKSGAAAT